MFGTVIRVAAKSALAAVAFKTALDVLEWTQRKETKEKVKQAVRDLPARVQQVPDLVRSGTDQARTVWRDATRRSTAPTTPPATSEDGDRW